MNESEEEDSQLQLVVRPEKKARTEKWTFPLELQNSVSGHYLERSVFRYKEKKKERVRGLCSIDKVSFP